MEEEHRTPWNGTLGSSGTHHRYTQTEFENALKRETAELVALGKPLIDPEWRKVHISNARVPREQHAEGG